MIKKKIVDTRVSDAEIRKLVIERLRTLSPERQVSIGEKGSFTKEELIEKVASKDPIGKKIIEVELEYLRALKEGKFLDE